MSRYRDHLQALVATSAAPYGYSLTIWTCGAVTTHAQGVPDAPEALLFLAGAIAAFALVGAVAHGSANHVLHPHREPTVRLWGGFHLPSVGLAIAASYLAVKLIPGTIAWPVVGFLSTAVYLLVIAAQFTTASARRR